MNLLNLASTASVPKNATDDTHTSSQHVSLTEPDFDRQVVRMKGDFLNYQGK
jgi:hypothetical protein